MKDFTNMGRKRDTDRDEQIRRELLAKTPTKVITEKTGASPSTISRRRQELKVLTIQSQKRCDRHQEQLIEMAKALEKYIDLPEPAFMDIEDLYMRRRWEAEWEMRPGLSVFRSIPTEVQNEKYQFFGREVEIMPLFKAHTLKTDLWRQFDKWGKLNGEYIWECWKRLVEIKHRVSCEKPPSIPLIKKTSDVKDGVLRDVTPQVCIMPMFYWTIYSYPLRANWSRSKLDYKTTATFENGICLVGLYCDKDECSPTPIFRAPCKQKEQLIRLHQSLLANYKLVESLKHKFQETVEIGKEIKKQLNDYITQEFVPGTCLLCSDWVKMQRLRAY